MDALTELIEERAILRLLNSYSHAMDYSDEAAWVDVFTPDAIFDTTEMVGGRTVHRTVGSAELAEYIKHYPKPPAYCKHVMVSPLVDVQDETHATVRAYWMFLQRDPAGAAPIVVAFGRYRDTLRKIDGAWKIAERYAEVEATTA